MSKVLETPRFSVRSPVIVALDFHSRNDCEALVERLDPELCRLKVGNEMFTLFGPPLIEALQSKGFDVFLDLKFHDIPATVAAAVRSAADLGVWMVNLHASGGARMMREAAEALGNYARPPLLIAVTVLTSMSESALAETGVTGSLNERVLKLAGLAQSSGLDGVVCSALEAGMLKSALGNDFKLVTPGIRPAGASTDDQTRIMTPAKAIAEGSDYLVIGRPITQDRDPAARCRSIIAELTQT